jgi:hypothetical protein
MRSSISALRRCLVVAAIALLTLLPVVPTDAIFIGALLTRFFSNLFLNASCQSGLTSMGQFAGCTCSVSNRRGVRKADFSCSIDLAQCLVEPNLFCIDGGFKGSVDFGSLPFLGLANSIDGCFEFTSGPPTETNEFGTFNKLCLSLDPRRSNRLSGCDVTIGGEECSKCDVCDSGQGITFSCANVDIGGPSYPAFVAGPEVTKCMRLNLTPA